MNQVARLFEQCAVWPSTVRRGAWRLFNLARTSGVGAQMNVYYDMHLLSEYRALRLAYTFTLRGWFF